MASIQLKKKYLAVHPDVHGAWKDKAKELGVPIMYLLKYIIENDFDVIIEKKIKEQWAEDHRIRTSKWGKNYE